MPDTDDTPRPTEPPDRVDLGAPGWDAATGHSQTTPRPSDPAGAADPPGDEAPDIPGYRFIRRLGRGGMGDVYLVRDLTLNQDRALKVAAAHGRDPTTVRLRFEREVRALAEVEHPNVVRIYHAGEANGRLYFVMPYVPAGAVSDHLARFTGKPRACAALVAKAAAGVQALHDHHLIHRDLKPQNLLLGDGDEPLVADTGLARLLADLAARPDAADGPPPGPDAGRPPRTATGAAVGTLYYMAPEQVEGRDDANGPGCDIWALGVTLYELLTGERPFAGADRPRTMYLILSADPPPLPREVPEGLARIVRRCLEKRPADRYPSARAVAEALDGWLAGPWWTRRGVLVGGGALALGAAGVAFGIARRYRPLARPVTLVGPTGSPARVDLVAGSEAEEGVAEDGFWQVAAAGHAVAELYAGPFPPRWVFEAEVGGVRAGVTGQFGIYVARRDWPAEPREVHTLVALTVYDPTVSLGPRRPKDAVTKHTIWPAAWAAGEQGLVPQGGVSGNSVVAERVSWYKVEFEVSAGTVRGVSGPLRRVVTEDTAARDFRLIAAGWAPRPTFTAPVLGSGIGILAFDATVRVRNATVRAVPSGTA
ncbi:MAG: hypothetical protein C0501_03545 [Isosphaera sp.]|nr:hypothetical protein [Isosphaera sp.]